MLVKAVYVALLVLVVLAILWLVGVEVRVS
jgi:hypothetical protein